MPAHHDRQLGARDAVLTGRGVRVEDDAECALGVLLKGHGARDEVAEASVLDEGGVGVVERDGLDGDEGGEAGIAEGRDYEVVVGRLSGVSLLNGCVSCEMKKVERGKVPPW